MLLNTLNFKLSKGFDLLGNKHTSNMILLFMHNLKVYEIYKIFKLILEDLLRLNKLNYVFFFLNIDFHWIDPLPDSVIELQCPCVSVCLYHCKTPTSGRGGDLWSKNVFLLLACDDKKTTHFRTLWILVVEEHIPNIGLQWYDLKKAFVFPKIVKTRCFGFPKKHILFGPMENKLANKNSKKNFPPTPNFKF